MCELCFKNYKHGNTDTALHVSSMKLSPETHEWHRDEPMAHHPLHMHTPELEGLDPVSVLPYQQQPLCSMLPHALHNK